ncbi:MAG: DUF3604 domain-containing protein, partial [Deltaproteobacteria bacterium]|nr:DUF3604 domain-containing protein [Deltaproteobacteria bacterium]
MQLTVPMDFVAMTDHAESFGLFEICAEKNLTETQIDFCNQFDRPSYNFFMRLRKGGTKRPPKREADLCGDDGVICFERGKDTWATIQNAADKYNQPGVFTAFHAYEYSPVLPKKGMLHRNVIFKTQTVPDVAFSAYDALSVLDLWRSLEETCTGDCDFLTIPHNMNTSWGLAYADETIDGDPYTTEDWALRGRSEPLAEIFQVKGSSEAAFGVGATDEECAFEQFFPPCEEGETDNCISLTSLARGGLKRGLELEEALGFNPLRFGFIGSTDNHNGNAGDTEEWDFRGHNGLYGAPAKKRMNLPKFAKIRNPGGLAAIWAEENTREALFDSMEKRETYATSGTRIRLRFFAGWELNDALLAGSDMIAKAYETGVPMGGVLNQPERYGNPKFLVWAIKDPDGANLSCIQMIKGWIENGERREKVFDIACSDGLTPDTESGRCPDNGARVDMSTCDVTDETGAAELKFMWQDDDFNPEQLAFYYVRVLQNPTCRWSTYDALRLGQPPRTDVPETVRERAWSSPIWYVPKAQNSTQ